MIQQKIVVYEKPLSVVWALVAIGLAYGTFQEILLQPDANLFIWLCLHLIAATLFLIRNKPIQVSSSLLAYLVALASVNYYLLYDLTPRESGVASWGYGLILLGGGLCMVSTLSLGKCFGVLPIYRGVQTRFAYRIVRHPIYASYILLDMGILLVYLSLSNFLIFSLALLLFILRIRFEEDVLEQAEAYRDYKHKVRFKLFPMLY